MSIRRSYRTSLRLGYDSAPGANTLGHCSCFQIVQINNAASRPAISPVSHHYLIPRYHVYPEHGKNYGRMYEDNGQSIRSMPAWTAASSDSWGERKLAEGTKALEADGTTNEIG
ncbi:hypothetical protein LOZ39_003200, partial [Ophidiomyces ophidiicola]